MRLVSLLVLALVLLAPAAARAQSQPCSNVACTVGRFLTDLGSALGWVDGPRTQPQDDSTRPQEDPFARATRAARQSIIDKTERHRMLQRTTGLGSHYGDKSAYYKLSDAERQAYVQSHALPGSTPLPPDQMTRSSCIEWTMEHVRAWYEAKGDLATWEKIEKTVQDQNLQGTALARALAEAGWRTVYMNADTSYTRDGEHGYSRLVVTEQGTYYGVPVQSRVENWTTDPSQLKSLKDEPFFVYVARGGLHVTAGYDGNVNELARGEGPDSKVIYQDPLDRIVDVYANDVYGGGEEGRDKALHMWGSGLVLLPPVR